MDRRPTTEAVSGSQAESDHSSAPVDWCCRGQCFSSFHRFLVGGKQRSRESPLLRAERVGPGPAHQYVGDTGSAGHRQAGAANSAINNACSIFSIL